MPNFVQQKRISLFIKIISVLSPIQLLLLVFVAEIASNYFHNQYFDYIYLGAIFTIVVTFFIFYTFVGYLFNLLREKWNIFVVYSSICCILLIFCAVYLQSVIFNNKINVVVDNFNSFLSIPIPFFLLGIFLLAVIAFVGLYTGFFIRKYTYARVRSLNEKGVDMFTKLKIFFVLLLISAIISAIFLFFKKHDTKNSASYNNDIDKQHVDFVVLTSESKIDVAAKKKKKRMDTSNNGQEEIGVSNYRYLVDNEQQIKEAAIKSIDDLYFNYDDMDFSHATAEEMIFVESANPDKDSSGYYLVVLRNQENEVMARVVLDILKEDGDRKLLETGNAEPFPPAFTDFEIQNQYRDAEKYPLTDTLPRVSEEKAFELAKQKIGDNFSYEGLTDLFVFLPQFDVPYQIGVPFSPYHKFIVNGDDKSTIWINSEDGFIVDYAHLENEIASFAEMMENEKLESPPPAEKDDVDDD